MSQLHCLQVGFRIHMFKKIFIPYSRKPSIFKNFGTLKGNPCTNGKSTTNKQHIYGTNCVLNLIKVPIIHKYKPDQDCNEWFEQVSIFCFLQDTRRFVLKIPQIRKEQSNALSCSIFQYQWLLRVIEFFFTSVVCYSAKVGVNNNFSCCQHLIFDVNFLTKIEALLPC